MNSKIQLENYSTDRHLKARDSFGYPVQVVRILDIWWDKAARKKVDKIPHTDWNLMRTQAVTWSIQRDGLMNPIPVRGQNGELFFYSGGQRIVIAQQLGYEFIDAIVLESKEELKELKILQAKSELTHLPDEVVDRWWDRL